MYVVCVFREYCVQKDVSGCESGFAGILSVWCQLEYLRKRKILNPKNWLIKNINRYRVKDKFQKIYHRIACIMIIDCMLI